MGSRVVRWEHPPSNRSIGREFSMLKFVGWAVAIIFLIGLLVVTGVLKLIF
jgi:hypothetical protein